MGTAYLEEGRSLGNARHVVQEPLQWPCSSRFGFSRIYCPQLSTSHAGPEMTLKPDKCPCSAWVLHGCSKYIGPAGSWHGAPADKPPLNAENWLGGSTKPYLNSVPCGLQDLAALGWKVEARGMLQHLVPSGHSLRITILKHLSCFYIKLAQLYSRSEERLFWFHAGTGSVQPDLLSFFLCFPCHSLFTFFFFSIPLRSTLFPPSPCLLHKVFHSVGYQKHLFWDWTLLPCKLNCILSAPNI